MSVPDGSGLRELLAAEAARLICEQGIHDYRLAKDKALRRIGGSRRTLPSNLEVDDAVIRYLSMYEERTRALLQEYRATAIRVLTLCAPFQPRLVGDVLRGVATEFSVVQLHLFTDVPEQVDIHLANRGIPYDEDDKRFRHPDGRHIEVPSCHLLAGQHAVELAIFGADDLRWAPLSPISGKPMQRADLAAVEALQAGTPRSGAPTPDQR